MLARLVKVLIVDDSQLVRDILANILSQDPMIQIVGSAADPLEAVKQIQLLKPDVITLDIEMPVMDGLTFLKKLMTTFPIPVVIISTLAKQGSDIAMRALELGAVDFIEKPTVRTGSNLESIHSIIMRKVRTAADVNIAELRRNLRNAEMKPQTQVTTQVQVFNQTTSQQVVVIGASTGGTIAVKKVVAQFPGQMPPVLVVMHMPGAFTGPYANELSNHSQLKCKVAEDREVMKDGFCYVAPGDYHTSIEKNRNGEYMIRIEQGDPINHHRPSIDYAFNAVAMAAGNKGIGVILTGMGEDGAAGLRNMFERGAFTVAQDKASSMVFGMPGRAIEIGAASQVYHIDQIGRAIVQRAFSSQR